MQDTKFVDFRVIKLRDWLNNHRECKKEIIIGNGHCNDSFKFIVCQSCNEAYFTGEV